MRTVAVTAGYVTEKARADFFRHIDATNVDLKGFTEDFYRQVCLGHLKPVLETLEWLVHESDTWVEVTTLLIPGLNDFERRDRASSAPGSQSASDRTSRCTSPRSIPTSGCATSLRLPPRRSLARGVKP